ncbi:hypothetical protein NA57DRAFT_75119 [Rhizodiscina lignyota]|uniref:PWI domain-containing protein n=1 Tax=Rhizodiscina lignyota TaxID=1504668 RepID=A0A9P4IGK4_9PEZI|nr:hypothetical protein NA57DRAFT_75119 [Rhizodiscina lignyota]
MAATVDQKLLKATKFPPEFNQKVDMSKVKVDVMKTWIAGKISEILGAEDDVVIELCFNLLEARFPDIKALQIQLTGFLEKHTAAFCKELWNLCLSAQSNELGVPKELLEAKKLELIQGKPKRPQKRSVAVESKSESVNERSREYGKESAENVDVEEAEVVVETSVGETMMVAVDPKTPGRHRAGDAVLHRGGRWTPTSRAEAEGAMIGLGAARRPLAGLLRVAVQYLGRLLQNTAGDRQVSRGAGRSRESALNAAQRDDPQAPQEVSPSWRSPKPLLKNHAHVRPEATACGESVVEEEGAHPLLDARNDAVVLHPQQVLGQGRGALGTIAEANHTGTRDHPQSPATPTLKDALILERTEMPLTILAGGVWHAAILAVARLRGSASVSAPLSATSRRGSAAGARPLEQRVAATPPRPPPRQNGHLQRRLKSETKERLRRWPEKGPEPVEAPKPEKPGLAWWISKVTTPKTEDFMRFATEE